MTDEEAWRTVCSPLPPLCHPEVRKGVRRGLYIAITLAVLAIATGVLIALAQ